MAYLLDANVFMQAKNLYRILRLKIYDPTRNIWMNCKIAISVNRLYMPSSLYT